MHVLYELRLEVNDDLELFAENKLIINFNPLSSNIMYNPKNLSRAYISKWTYCTMKNQS